MVEIPAEYLPFHNAELVVGIFSLIANGTLFYLILYKTPKELLEYRPFVFMVTLADLLFDVYVVFLIRPVMIFPVLAAIITGPIKVFGTDVVFYLSFLGILMFCYCMICINMAFFYRYTCITLNSYRHEFTRRKTQICLHCALIGTLIVILTYPAMQKEDHATLIYMVEQNIPAFIDHVDDFVIVAVRSIDIWVPTAIMLLFLPSCTLNAILALLIVKKLRSVRTSFSAATYRMHIRLMACLLCQTFSPIILLALPIMMAFYYSVTDKYSPNLRLVGSAFFFPIACHPLINALCTLFFVKPYRRVIINDQWIHYMASIFRVKNINPNGHRTIDPTIASIEMNGQALTKVER